MARTSKRYLKQKQEEKQTKTYYRAGIYTRLSNDRTESWREKSSSIETQVLNCKEYALKENIEVVEVFTDYEYSGTNFERPAFIEMMDSIKTRKINCIIIRDLSRLGREHLEMGRLIDKVFPFLGVRFISVSDKVDTVKDLGSKKSFEITLKNIVNDMYAKDISVKIKTSVQNRARKGYFTGSVAPYGYKIEKLKDGQKLIVDKNVSFIVKEIFDLAIKGKTQVEIARVFNRKGYATPMTYFKTSRVYSVDGDPEWNIASIYKMIRNKAYIGTLVQGIRQQNLAKGLKPYKADESEHIIVENTHEAIISKEKQEKALSIIKERYKKCEPKFKDLKIDYENRYKGLIKSKKSGKNLYRDKQVYGVKRNRVVYYFRRRSCNGKLNQKETLTVMERDLDNSIALKISELLNMYAQKENLIDNTSNRIDKFIKDIEVDIKKLALKLEKEESLISKAYENYSLGKVDKSKYLSIKENAHNHMNIINTEIEKLKSDIYELTTKKVLYTKWIDDLFKAEDTEKLSSELLHSLIEKILVDEDNSIEIFFKFNIENMREVEDE